jgi:hypothetical protein
MILNDHVSQEQLLSAILFCVKLGLKHFASFSLSLCTYLADVTKSVIKIRVVIQHAVPIITVLLASQENVGRHR